MVHLEGAAFLASTRTQLLKQELRASARRVIFHALHHVLGPAAWRASRNHVLMILIGCEWTPAYGLPAPRFNYGEMMHYDEAARIRVIAVAMDEDPSVYLQTNEGDPSKLCDTPLASELQGSLGTCRRDLDQVESREMVLEDKERSQCSAQFRLHSLRTLLHLSSQEPCL